LLYQARVLLQQRFHQLGVVAGSSAQHVRGTFLQLSRLLQLQQRHQGRQPT
jgi:hypothetical protein